MEFLKHVVKDICDILITLIIRNPCKKCLVRACCSLLCKEKRHYLTFCNIDGNIKFLRMCAMGTILSCILIFFSTLATCIFRK